MNAHIRTSPGRGLLASFAALAALLAGPCFAQSNAADDSASLNREFASDMEDRVSGASSRIMDNFGNDRMEAGTIPAARPGLPQQQASGAQGPIRWDEIRPNRTDPTIRDTFPLTVNGVWEQHFGNVVTPSNQAMAGSNEMPGAR